MPVPLPLMIEDILPFPSALLDAFGRNTFTALMVVPLVGWLPLIEALPLPPVTFLEKYIRSPELKGERDSAARRMFLSSVLLLPPDARGHPSHAYQLPT